METQDILVNRRGQIKAKITRFHKYIDESVSLDPIQIKLRLEKITDLYDQFDSVQEKLEALDSTDPQHIIERNQFEAMYFQALTRGKTILQQLEVEVPHEQKYNITDSSTKRMILPKIQLPTFTGKLEEWISYWDTFNSLVHKNTCLNTIEKFYFLKGSLQGQAKTIINSLELSDSNYEVAINLLFQRYKNTRAIIQRHIKLLFEEPTKIVKENAVALKTLLDSTVKHVRAVQALSVNIEHWDPILLHMVSSKFDSTTLRAWELENTTDTLPTFKQLCDFTQHRIDMLEAVYATETLVDTPSPKNTLKTKIKSNSKSHYKSNVNTFVLNTKQICTLCEATHYLYACDKFRAMSIKDRLAFIATQKCCRNCLRNTHDIRKCTSMSCKICNKRHNTLLHNTQHKYAQNDLSHLRKQQTSEADTRSDVTKTQSEKTKSQTSSVIEPTVQTNSSTFTTMNEYKQNLLPTASILIKTKQGFKKCRALLDSASHSNFITQECAKRLNLDSTHTDVTITSLNQNLTKSLQRATIDFMPVYDRTKNWKLECLVVDNISNNIPPIHIQANLHISDHVKLADERFDKPSQIDVLIGADLFWELLLEKTIKLNSNITLRETKLGFIVTGYLPTTDNKINTNLHLVTNEHLSQQLETFWNIEELPMHKILTQEEQLAETDFQNTVQRDSDGRYVVHLPRNHLSQHLGTSKAQAFKRFYSLESRLNKDTELKQAYTQFMKEYEDLSHMTLASDDVESEQDSYYLPHHPVLKPDSSTTKLRVVFDGSAKSSTGISLNDTLINGPVVQSELYDIMIRFRLSNYILTGDIEKMYRMILVQTEQQSLQRILWRSSRDQLIKIYDLKTITYGLSNSPYLATRTLIQLCEDQAKDYPVASDLLKYNTYVDDTILTADSESELLIIKQDIESILKSAGFHMRKWCSNSRNIIDQIPVYDRAKESIFIPGKDETVKSLGTFWNPQYDTLQFQVNVKETKYTKRTILSEIAKIFDILGLLGPVILKAKMFMQNLWNCNLDWDDKLSDNLIHKWLKIKHNLLQLANISIPRLVLSSKNSVELHVFSDASEKGYGTCIYVRTAHYDEYTSNLLASKCKVAPLKAVTLPRLELCAAVLASKLTHKIVAAMKIAIQSINYWTDSKIVIAWLSRPPSTWHTFVANRVATIQNLTSPNKWRYVNTHNNPADLVSRGSTTEELQQSWLWWHGPCFLQLEKQQWHDQEIIASDKEIPEMKRNTSCFLTQQDNLWEQYSNFNKLVRVIAYCKRFIYNSRPSTLIKKKGNLSVQDLDTAHDTIIKMIQAESFQSELKLVSNKQPVAKSSSLKALNPYVDKKGLLRVGGRLHQSNLPMDERHPILLPNNHPVSRLIIKKEHLSNLHVGAQTLLFLIRQKYWPVNGKRMVNSLLSNCIVCFKNKPTAATQLMGQLPATRIMPNRPFLYTGTDMAGPVMIKASNLRNAKLIKAYIAIFVCFVTKAVHLELVSDMSTQAFLAAFRRFISRRGLSAHVYSDNAKNYVGAAKELQQIQNSQEFQNEVQQYAINLGISWHFTPPYGPSHGGLWESNIKIMKNHLNRTVGNLHYTFETMSTLLTQIEASMNSRPISPLSHDPNDLLPLTPGHFLVGHPLVVPPTHNFISIPENRLSKWQHVQQSAQHFWYRWSKEYLNLLQTRKYWQNQKENVQIGDLVLLKTDYSPPLTWKTGRIVEIHPGKDKVVRVVTVRTSEGIFKRPITKVCQFPKEN